MVGVRRLRQLRLVGKGSGWLDVQKVYFSYLMDNNDC